MAIEDKTSNNVHELVAGARPGAEATNEDCATGTVLDYLWVGQERDAAENLPESSMQKAGMKTPGPEDAALAADAETDPEPPSARSLQSTLKNYSRWLDSIGTD